MRLNLLISTTVAKWVKVVCKQASKDGSKKRWIKKEPHGRPIRTVQEDFQQLENALNHIRTKLGQPYKVDLQIDSKPFTIEIDTGASMSLIEFYTARIQRSNY